MPGNLTIVGLGPARPEQVTWEARQLLRAPASQHRRAYGLAHARQLANEIAPRLHVRALDYLYALPGVDRPAAYRDLAHMLRRRAFDDGFEVLYLVAGSPLVYNDAVLRIRHSSAAAGQALRLVQGVSFLELVLERVYWTGGHGLQVYSAWNLAHDGFQLQPETPALICQLGEFTQGGEALDTRGSLVMLRELRDALLRQLPANHPVAVLHSSGSPDYRSLARGLRLDALAEQQVPVYSNLWVPALRGPQLERELAPEQA